jgi:hypothetical protein
MASMDVSKDGGQPGIDREAPRVLVSADVQLRSPGKGGQTVHLRDLAIDGCSIEAFNLVQLGEEFWIKFPGLDAMECTVCWDTKFVAGLKFVRPLHPGVMDILVKRLNA